MFDEQFFQPDQLLPEGQDPQIVELRAAPYPDNRRVQVTFRLTPFSSPPCAALRILNPEGAELASTDLVNILHLESEITLHLPAGGIQPGEYQVILELFRLEDLDLEAGEDPKPEVQRTDLDISRAPFTLP